MILSIRRVLNTVIRNVVLDDFELNTVMCEVESVVNNRPITPVSDDNDDAEALTPSHMLVLDVTGTPPPTKTDAADQHRRRWKYIQGLVD